jgi:hypothetical protein
MKLIEKILHFIVEIQLRIFVSKGWFSGKDKFKKGDIVVYNWKAKVYIFSAIKDELGSHEIINITKYSDSDGIGWIDTKYGGTTGADAFWLRKTRLTN